MTTLFLSAVKLIVRNQKSSGSFVYLIVKDSGIAADLLWPETNRLLKDLESAKIIGPFLGSQKRAVLVKNLVELEKLIAELDKT